MTVRHSTWWCHKGLVESWIVWTIGGCQLGLVIWEEVVLIFLPVGFYVC